MNCNNCGTPLIPGNNTCPACGALNMPLNPPAASPQEETLETIDNTPNENQVAASTEVPSLNVIEETLEEDTKSLEESTPTTTYEQTEELPETLEKIEDIKIDIPAQTSNALTPVDQNVQEGGVATVEAPIETVGSDIVVPEKGVTSFKFGKKTIKFKVGKFNAQHIIVLVGMFGIGLLIGYMMFGNRTTTRCYKSPVSTKNLISNGKNNITYTNGFKYTIPDSYTYDKSNEGIIIYDNDQTFKMYLKSMVFKYDQIVNAKLSLQQTLIDNQMKVENIKEIGINEHNYLVITATVGMYNRMFALTDAGNNKIFYIEIVTTDNKFNSEILKIADDIIVNAEATTDLTATEKISIKDVSTLITETSQYDSDLKMQGN